MDDLISKTSVCEIIADIYPTDGEKVVAVKEIDKAYEAIQQLPSAQPERKRGKWVGADSQCGIGCPFCGAPVDDFCSSIDYIDLRYEPNFCPNCGADMRGGQNG